MLATYGGAQLASRQTFLIGPDGKIVKHWAKVDPKGHSDMVLAEIKAHSGQGAAKSRVHRDGVICNAARGSARQRTIFRAFSIEFAECSLAQLAHGAVEAVERQRKHAAADELARDVDGRRPFPAVFRLRIEPHQAREMRRDPRHPYAAGFLVPVFDAAAGLLDFVRAHGGVADEHHAVVGVERPQQRQVSVITLKRRRLSFHSRSYGKLWK